MLFSKVLSKLFSFFPQGVLKDRVRVWLYNLPRNNEFTISKRKNLWVASYPDFKLKFVEEIIPFHVLKTNYLFAKHFPITPVDILVDAGAFIGSFSLYITNKYPEIKKIIVFEPDDSTNRVLQKNLELNNHPDLEVKSIGLWSKKAMLSFFPNQLLSSSVFNQGKEESNVKIEVDSLDNILQHVAGKRLFIKMNIEGAEIEALHGCRNLIKNNKVYFAISADHIVNSEITQKKVEEICQNMELSVTTFSTKEYIVVYASNEVIYS